MNMNKFCLKSFQKLDIFGSEISLNYKKDSIFRSAFGGFVAIICVLILVLLFFNNIVTLISKSKLFNKTIFQKQNSLKENIQFKKAQVSVINSVNYDPNPDIFEIGYNQMMIAVKYDQDNFISRPKMKLTFEKRHYIRHDNGTFEQIKIPVPLEPCTVEHFENLPNYNIDWKLAFQLSQLEDYLCLQKGLNFKIGGRYESQEFYHVKFMLKKCENTTSPLELWNPVCDTPENINKTSEDTRIRFIFSNTLLHPENAKEPIQTIQDSLIFNVQPQQVFKYFTLEIILKFFNQLKKMYTTANVMLNQQTVRTDESITLFKDFQEQKFVSFSSTDYKQQFSVGNFTKYAELFFLRSSFSTTSTRSFLKIDQVISYMGGFCQVFLLFSAIIGKQINKKLDMNQSNFKLFFNNLIVSQVNEYIYDIELANKLYDFDIQNKSQSNYKPVMKRKTFIQSRMNDKFNFSQNIHGKILTEGDFAQRVNQFQNTILKYMQDTPKNLNQKNSFLQQNQIQDKNNKATTNVLNNQSQEKENINKNSPFHSQQNDLREEYHTTTNLHKEEIIEDNQVSSRIDSIRPILTLRDVKNSQFSKDGQLINYEQNQQQQENEQEKQGDIKNSKSSLEYNLQKQEEDQTIDISKINSQMRKQQTCQSTTEKTVSKNYLHKNSTLNRNSLFEFQSEGNVNKKINEQEEVLNQTFAQNNLTKERQERLFASENKQFLEQELKYIVQRDRTLNLNIKYFINKITCGKFYNTNEVILLNKAIDQVKQDLDIFNILDRQKEIEKFKNLFLTHDQQVLFNFFPKPLIKVSNDQAILSRTSLRNLADSEQLSLRRFQKRQSKKLNINIKNIAVLSKAIVKFKQNLHNQNISEYQQLFNCYQKIMQENTSEMEKVLNKKLIDQLGSEMKTIFEIAYKQNNQNKNIYKTSINFINSMKLRQQEKEQNISQNRINYMPPSQNIILNPSLFFNLRQRQLNNFNSEENTPQSHKTDQNQETEKNHLFKETVPKIDEVSFEKEKQPKESSEKNQLDDNLYQEGTNQLIVFDQVEEEGDDEDGDNNNNDDNLQNA